MELANKQSFCRHTGRIIQNSIDNIAETLTCAVLNVPVVQVQHTVERLPDILVL